MSTGYESLLMISIIIFMLISVHSTHILIVDALTVAGEGIHGRKELHFREENGDGTRKHQIEEVSGEDENEQKEALIVKKFRDLLGLKSSKPRRHSTEDIYNVSPSPSPSPTIEPAEPPAAAPAPAPVRLLHGHPHPPPPRSSQIPAHLKNERESTDNGRVKRILVPVLISTGAVFAVCVLGLICFCGKFKKNRNQSRNIVSVYSKKARSRGKSRYVNSQNSTTSSKVSLNPGLDLFYLSTLEMDLEQQQQQQPTSCVKPTTPVTVNTSSNQGSPNHRLLEREEEEEQNQEFIKSESDNASSSCTREIMSVHEDEDDVKYESDGGNSSSGDKIIPIECHSSNDDDSFHSFNDSNSNVRLSNASIGSLGDTSGLCDAVVPQRLASPLPSPTKLPLPQATASPSNSPTHSLQEDNLAVTCSPDCQKNFTPPHPPPPPPPPPPPHMAPTTHIFASHTKIIPVASSSTLPRLSPPRNSDSSAGSSQTPHREVLSSPKKHFTDCIPPPPCPPPFLKGNAKFVKGPPPPPPSQLPQCTPLGKDGTPLPKLKPLHWDKVRAAPDRSMVWDKLRSSSFELDEEMIESLFGYDIQNAMKNDEAKSKSPSPTKHVLEPKRLQNITILSKALNVSCEQVCDALMKGEGLGLQQLEALVKMVPTKEEEGKLCSYKGDIDKLGSAERFVKALLGIPFAFQRVEAMLYRETFEDEAVHLRNSFSMLEEACKELRSSRLFLKLLEAVLKTGNRMNVGTIRGGAKAFKLDALLKLADVKGTDGKTTLLHFVVQEIIRAEGIRVSDSIMGQINQRNKTTKTAEEKEEDYKRMGLDLVAGLSTELYNVKKTATIDIDVLANSVSNLSSGMAKLKQLVTKDLCDEKNGNFAQSMKSFINYAERNLRELQEDERRVLSLVREITEYFHGNVSKEEAHPLRIFVIVRDFLAMLDHVCKELRSLKAPTSPNPLALFR